MKNKVFFLLVIGVCLMSLMFSLSACDRTKKISCITDFSEYATMPREADRIEVTFDRNTGTPFYFTIEEQSTIEQIMNIIFEASFEKQERDVNGGSHTSIKVIQGSKEFSLGVLRINENYVFASNELQLRIEECAREAGAYENAN